MLKSLIVAAPAGSGKTEELARRYIDLLKENVEPERILTLTFTDKAAAEMKERILRRLREKHPNLYIKVRESILRLRISTIHSFCLGLLRRFAPHVGMDPALEGLEEAGASALWQRALYDTLTRIAAEPRASADYRNLMALVSRGKSIGWEKLTDQFSRLYAKRVAVEHAVIAPAAQQSFEHLRSQLSSNPIGRERVPGYAKLFPGSPTSQSVSLALERLREHEPVFLNASGSPIRRRGVPDDVKAWNEQMALYRNVLLTLLDYDEFGRMLDLFRRRFLATYDEYKNEAGTVDFVDMEHRALKIISKDSHWQDILFAFDEGTDHLLVDEFQDTSYLQWAIVLKLTEEWRAGKGAKADQGIEPTVFLVGDVKQSIYLFRDAKVEVFAEARKRLHADLGDRVQELSLKYNYRSLQAIVDFTNTFFSRLMVPPASDTEAWRTAYERFERRRKNDAPGRVEVLLGRSDAKMPERRELEADIIAQRIQSLVASAKPFTIYRKEGDVEIEQACQHGDIAILMRKRTHLGLLTDVLHQRGIPFITVGGDGFYSESEVCHLKSLLSFLVDPTDGFALYAVLRGALFSMPERDLLLAGAAPGRYLWDRLNSQASTSPALDSAVARLRGWLARVNRQTLASILEQALSEQQGWKAFWEPQRVANIRKFLRIIEEMENAGQHPLRIKEHLQGAPDEKRADVSIETKKAVQIMTIHGAKGLQFPVVFYIGGDMPLKEQDRDALLIEERGPELAWVSYIEKSHLRKENSFHEQHAEKEAEEEKRACYVACTRATDALFLTGVWYKKRDNTVIGWLEQHLGLREEGSGFKLDREISGVHCLTQADIPAAAAAPPAGKLPKPPVLVAEIAPKPAPSVHAVTRNLALDFRRFGEDAVGLGDLIHKLLEEISNGKLAADGPQLSAEINRLLGLAGLAASLSDRLLSTINSLLSDPAVGNIVKSQPSSHAELPIMYSDAGTTFTGRIDRVIVTETEVRLFDYKTFDVGRKEIPELVRKYYDGQLRHYEKACRRLWPGRKVSSFLIFTALPIIVPADK